MVRAMFPTSRTYHDSRFWSWRVSWWKQFVFPEQKQKTKSLKVLDPDIDEKYTLSDKLWNYLQNLMRRNIVPKVMDSVWACGSWRISRTLSARYYRWVEILIPQTAERIPRLSPWMRPFNGVSWWIPSQSGFDVQAYRQCGNSVVIPPRPFQSS